MLLLSILLHPIRVIHYTVLDLLLLVLCKQLLYWALCWHPAQHFCTARRNFGWHVKAGGFGATCLSNGMEAGVHQRRGWVGVWGATVANSRYRGGGGSELGREECLFQAASKANGRQSNFLWFHQACVLDPGALGNAERTGRWPLTWTCKKHVGCAHSYTSILANIRMYGQQNCTPKILFHFQYYVQGWLICWLFSQVIVKLSVTVSCFIQMSWVLFISDVQNLQI